MPRNGDGAGREAGQKSHSLWVGLGAAGIDDCPPGGAEFVAGVETKGADQVALDAEVSGRPFGVVDKILGEAVRVDVWVEKVIGHIWKVFGGGGMDGGVGRRVEVDADWETAEGEFFGTVGGSGAGIPETLAILGEDECEKTESEIVVGGAAEDADGVGADARAALRGGVIHVGNAVGCFGVFGLEAAEEVDGDTGGEGAGADVDGDLSCGIRKVFGVGADEADEIETIFPGGRDGGEVVRRSGRRVQKRERRGRVETGRSERSDVGR